MQISFLETARKHFLGEIETEIVGARHHKTKASPGERANLERESENPHDRCAIRVENGRFDKVGYLPRKIASWLAPLIDSEQISLDGYVPQVTQETCEEQPKCPITLMVFQCEKGRQFLQKAEPTSDQESLHQVILQAYQNAQSYRNPELLLGLAKGLQPLEKQDLLPESRLLLALLPRMTNELRMSQALESTVKFRDLLDTVTLGEPMHHHNLTLFPLLWPESQMPPYTLLSTAIGTGEAVVEEVSEKGSVSTLTVTNRCDRPILIPEGEILIGAKQNRVVNVTVLVAAGTTFVLPVSCVEAGRWRYNTRHFVPKFCAPPSLRNKKLRAVHRNRSMGGPAASCQNEVWDEVHACLSDIHATSETASLADGFMFAIGKLEDYRKYFPMPSGVAGVLLGRHDRIIGMDLFDSPATF